VKSYSNVAQLVSTCKYFQLEGIGMFIRKKRKKKNKEEERMGNKDVAALCIHSYFIVVKLLFFS